MAPRAFLDTNVLVYAFDVSDIEKRSAALELLESREIEQVFSTQVLSEFYVVSTRKLRKPLPERDAATFVRRISSGFPTVAIDPPLVDDALRIHKRNRISYWDGLIVAAASSAGCECLLSEDLSHGQSIAGVRIENPFA